MTAHRLFGAFLAIAVAFASMLGGAPAKAHSDHFDLDTVPLKAVAVNAVLACRIDARRLCPGVPRGDGQVVACLASKRAYLRPSCEREFRKGDMLWDAMLTCERDINRFCSNVPAGHGRVLRCLEDHQLKLSHPCFYSLADSIEAYGGYVHR